MDKKFRETTNLCVEIMNSKQQVMGKLAWSHASKLAFAIFCNVMSNLSIVLL